MSIDNTFDGTRSIVPVLLDDRIRGVAPGMDAFDSDTVGVLNWHPAEGTMALPVLTLNEDAFLGNRDLMLGYVRHHGVALAPHGKTPMAPDLALNLVAAGAWGATVADIRQAAVMLRAGLNRLILANEVGGLGGARRLAALMARWPKAEVSVFVDSVAAAEALATAWKERPDLAPLRILPELGAGRAGARSSEALDAIIDTALAADGRLAVSGIGAYEGSTSRSTPEATLAAIEDLIELVGQSFVRLRSRLGQSVPLLVTAGGSVYFDRVVAGLSPAIAADGNATLVLRSGAIFFSDHGIYDKALAALDQRGGFASDGRAGNARDRFQPALRLWAEVLSRPEPDLAICGLGMRDASFDQGFPIPLAAYRDGAPLPNDLSAEVTRLNDQHAFLRLAHPDALRVGDVVEFGISHPCTCIDRYRVLFGVDGAGRVRHAFPTFFG